MRSSRHMVAFGFKFCGTHVNMSGSFVGNNHTLIPRPFFSSMHLWEKWATFTRQCRRFFTQLFTPFLALFTPVMPGSLHIFHTTNYNKYFLSKEFQL